MGLISSLTTLLSGEGKSAKEAVILLSFVFVVVSVCCHFCCCLFVVVFVAVSICCCFRCCFCLLLFLLVVVRTEQDVRLGLQSICYKNVSLRKYGHFNGHTVLCHFELLTSTEKLQKQSFFTIKVAETALRHIHVHMCLKAVSVTLIV